MEDLEPTFYLNGQPYIFNEEVCKGGPELALIAIQHTLGYVYSILGEWAAGRMTSDERLRQQTELIMGAWALRDLIPGDDILIPNASFIIVH